MNRKSFYTFLLLIGWSVSFCSGQHGPNASAEEIQQFQVEIDEWMKPYRVEKRNEFDQWIALILDNPTMALEHNVYKHMQTFINKHQEKYLQFRRADIARYPRLDNHLEDYEQVDDFEGFIDREESVSTESLNVLQDINNLRILNIKALNNSTPMISSYAFNYIDEKVDGIDYMEIYQSYALGIKAFADQVNDNQWQFTWISRMFAVQFTWDITSNHISLPKLYLYKEEKHPKAWLADVHLKSTTKKDELYRKLDSLRWTIYDEIDQEISVYDQHEIWSEMASKFYEDNRATYTTLRRESLLKLPDLNSDLWKTYPKDAAEAADDVRQEMNMGFFEEETQLPVVINIYNLDAFEIFHHVVNVLSRHAERDRDHTIYQWLLGYEIAAREVEKDKWEIHFFFDDHAFKYLWNIATDEISGLMVKSK